MKLSTVLLSGAGNTFHLIHNAGDVNNLSDLQKKQITIEICKKNKADGVIFLNLKTDSKTTYQWCFYNNDGSDAEMCGNATRCVGYYIKNVLNDDLQAWELETKAGLIKIKSLANDLFEVKMTKLVLLHSEHGFFCNTGVPHLVLELDNFETYKSQKEFASQLRFNESFGVAGTNVTFVKVLHDVTKLNAVSFERGVEDFTEACGTGAMAAAFYNYFKNKCTKTDVEMPGGMLNMDVSNLDVPVMIGSAKILGKFTYEI